VQAGAGPRPYDVSTRRLIEGDPEGWLAWIGLPPDGPVTPIDSDVGTVLAEVDKVLRVDGPSPWIAHLELQASNDPRLPARMLQYNALLAHRHQIAVETTVVLLRPEADGRELTGLFEMHGPTGFRTVSFGYHVIRLWERPVDELLRGSLGVLPMAPLAEVEPSRLPDILRLLEERFSHETDPTLVGELWSATFLLLGLRYDRGTIHEVLERMSWLKESTTYQMILEEGRAEGEARGEARGRVGEARRLVQTLGSDKFGAPDQAILAALFEMDDLDHLEFLMRRILTTNTWAELLGTALDH
jgi:predicted transposase YdaD